jgi:hypothetical protein
MSTCVVPCPCPERDGARLRRQHARISVGVLPGCGHGPGRVLPFYFSVLRSNPDVCMGLFCVCVIVWVVCA